ncbi:MAG: serine/threonine-protein phosphatase [Phycisphaerales bacterium]|nr:MAG: serine/threonine-protein phosphatase [Phycisphaerales bacterium]
MHQQVRLQILLDGVGLTSEVHEAIRSVHANPVVRPFSATPPRCSSEPLGARLIVTADTRALVGQKLVHLDEWLTSNPCPTLVLSKNAVDVPDLCEKTALGRPVSFARWVCRDELAGRLSAMFGMTRSMDALRDELAKLREHEQALRSSVRELNDELREAGVLQRNLLPLSLPEVEGVDVDVVYQPASALSGDVYDIFRLDDSHIAVCLADATGHGVPAALLSTFIRWSLSKRRIGDVFLAPPHPDQVLESLNRDLIDMQLEECHFVAALFAVYNEHTRVMRLARAGLPYPIHTRQGGPPERLRSAGTIVGVDEHARFEVIEVHLEPGEAVLFHTDGLDALLNHGAHTSGYRPIEQTAWFRELGRGSIARQLAQVQTRLAHCADDDPKLDDTTVIAFGLRSEAPLDELAPALDGSLAPLSA